MLLPCTCLTPWLTLYTVYNVLSSRQNNCEQLHNPHAFLYHRDSGLVASWHIAASPPSASPATVSFTQVSATDQRQIQTAIAEMNASKGPDKHGKSLPDWAPVSMGAGKGRPANYGVSSSCLGCRALCCAVLSCPVLCEIKAGPCHPFFTVLDASGAAADMLHCIMP